MSLLAFVLRYSHGDDDDDDEDDDGDGDYGEDLGFKSISSAPLKHCLTIRK